MQHNLNMYMLLADSGSSKTAWGLQSPSGKTSYFCTQGINPVTQDADRIRLTLEHELVPQLNQLLPAEAHLNIYFYGAGCIPSACPQMAGLLERMRPHTTARVYSDLLGAARALCGRQEGIACILGTGSNSCYYNGADIEAHTAPLGYILGDEGSGATLGKHLLADLLKGQLPDGIRTAFFQTYPLNEASIINKVYRESGANRFLASFAPFLYQHKNDESVHRLLIENFRAFFRRNITSYGRPHLPVHFVGSIAWFFQDELKEAATLEGFVTGQIIQAPIAAIVNFHSL